MENTNTLRCCDHVRLYVYKAKNVIFSYIQSQ